MCEIFNEIWTALIGIAFLLSLGYLLLRAKYVGPRTRRLGDSAGAGEKQLLAQVHLWGTLLVVLTMFGLFVVGFLCTNSPGDFRSVIPN